MERKKFTDMGLSEPILKAIDDLGFEEATPIQTAAIPVILDGHDVTGHSKTGTGKTMAFGIPALELIDKDSKKTQVLVLCPTRELAIQASGEIRKITKYFEGIKVVPIYGGQSIDRQIKSLKGGVQIVIGTPGRVMDHMRRKTLRFDELKMLVLDEADEMLNMGFREDIEKILTEIPEKRQTLLFSATMPREIMDITYYYQYDPEYIQIIHNTLTVPEVDQYYLEVSYGRKAEVLGRLIDIENPKQTLIFCNTKKMVDELVGELRKRGYMAEGLHGGMRQSVRTRTMKSFRAGTLEILVATDVAARGIDIDDIEVVVNYDVPQDEEYYVHRIGRTARAGRKGRSFTFVSDHRDLMDLEEIQKYINAEVVFMKTPDIDEVNGINDTKITEDIKRVIGDGGLEKYMPTIDRLMSEDYTSAEIAAALIKLMHVKESAPEPKYSLKDIENTGGEPGMARFRINAGKDQGIRPGDIVGAIAGESGIHGSMVGAIKIKDKCTYVDIPFECALDVINVMHDNKIKGKKIKMEPAKPDKQDKKPNKKTSGKKPNKKNKKDA
ncbi:MAG: DEAD/DEAH box helicase [Clostridia bacterium]|nr:DEAD/DEAH box helicase [Clostridia bacterium]